VGKTSQNVTQLYYTHNYGRKKWTIFNK